jgi:hypothetical protein
MEQNLTIEERFDRALSELSEITKHHTWKSIRGWVPTLPLFENMSIAYGHLQETKRLFIELMEMESVNDEPGKPYDI